jgi:hypothetical protein
VEDQALHASSGARTALGIVAGLVWLAIGCGGEPSGGSEPPPTDPAQASAEAAEPDLAPEPVVLEADGFVHGQALPEGFPELPVLEGIEYYGSLGNGGRGARWISSGTPEETSERLQAMFSDAGWEIGGVTEAEDGVVILATLGEHAILGALSPSPDGGTHVDLAAGAP